MKSLTLFLISILFFSINPLFAETREEGKNPHVNTHPKNWKTAEIPKLLEKGKVISIYPMREYLQSCGRKVEFDGKVFLVELDNGLKAVFKSLPLDDLGDAYAEVAAYKASVALGFPQVPPTIMTKIKGMKGSLQLFVETNIDPLASGTYNAALKEAEAEDVANLYLFYFIFGQWDSGPHNILIFKDQDETHLIAIDNSGIRNHQHVTYGTLPFVRVSYSDALQTDDWDKPFPADQAKTIQNPTPEKLKKSFGDAFPDSFYQSFKSYGLPLHYVIYRNSLWRQYHMGNAMFVMPFTNHISDQTRKSLKSLNLKLLKKIFACAKDADFLTSDYFKAILDRRDKVLQYFDERASH